MCTRSVYICVFFHSINIRQDGKSVQNWDNIKSRNMRYINEFRHMKVRRVENISKLSNQYMYMYVGLLLFNYHVNSSLTIGTLLISSDISLLISNWHDISHFICECLCIGNVYSLGDLSLSCYKTDVLLVHKLLSMDICDVYSTV